MVIARTCLSVPPPPACLQQLMLLLAHLHQVLLPAALLVACLRQPSRKCCSRCLSRLPTSPHRLHVAPLALLALQAATRSTTEKVGRP